MKELLEYLVKSIVDQPEEVRVEEEIARNGLVTILLWAAPQDMGKVIGKQGRIIKAIRKICAIRALKEGKRLNIQLLEESTPQV